MLIAEMQLIKTAFSLKKLKEKALKMRDKINFKKEQNYRLINNSAIMWVKRSSFRLDMGESMKKKIKKTETESRQRIGR